MRKPVEVAKIARQVAIKFLQACYPKCKINDDEKVYSDLEVTLLDNTKLYFSVKGTEKDPSKYFGATSINKLIAAIVDEKNYILDVLLVNIDGISSDDVESLDENEIKSRVQRCTLDEILCYMYVPPFKLNIDLSNQLRNEKNIDKMKKTIKKIYQYYQEIKGGNNNQ